MYDDKRKSIRCVDLVFTIDTTASMGDFMYSAKRNLQNIIGKLSDKYDLDLKVGGVEYRDHPPQDHSFVARNISNGLVKPETACDKISNLGVDGGGDGAEAVFDGIIKMTEMLFRDSSLRIGILVGDAPPHGMGAGQSQDLKWNKQCPCGTTLDDISAALEENGMTLFSVAMNNDVKKYWEKICNGKERVVSFDHTLKMIEEKLSEFVSEVEIDEKVFDLFVEGMVEDDIAEKLELSKREVLNSVGRMISRDILTENMIVAKEIAND